VHRGELAASLAQADRVWFHRPTDLDWDLGAVAAEIGPQAGVTDDVDALAATLAAELQPGDHVLIMSNGSFGGLHDKLLAALGARHAA
jgi:UDP-N-acetylmuramate: L-alanyl-gamma-D-glutamyl-meso-diaminopimelate ligase